MMKLGKHMTLSLLLLVGAVALSEPSTKASARRVQTYKQGKKIIKVRVERDVMMADQLMLKGKYADAAEFYRQAVARNSGNAQAIAGLGMALGKQFKLDGALAEFNKALQLDKHNALAHSGKAMVLVNRLQSSSMSVIKNRDSLLQQAEREGQEATRLDPTMPEAHYNLGMAYKEEGKLADAAAELRQAISCDSQFADAYAQLGLVQLTENNPDEASASFKKAIGVNSGNSTAHYGLGKTYLAQGRIDDAIKELNTSLYQYRNSAPVHQALGEAYAQQGNAVAAVKEFKEAIRIKPETMSSYLKLADIHETRGDLELAVADLRSGLELMPDNSALQLAVAENCLKLGKLDDALKEYQKVLASNPQNEEAVKGLTRCYYLKAQKEATGAFISSNEFEQADAQIQQAIRLHPDDMELRLAEAKLRALAGSPVDLSAIAKPQTDGERVAYAEALLAQNSFKEASEQMSIVLSHAQEQKQVYAVGDLALLIRDLNTAATAYNKAKTYPGSIDRAKRGLAQVDKARDAARQDLTLADDLARKKQLASAIDKYHSAIFGNPVVSEAHKGLASALERQSPAKAADLKQAATQWRAYMALSPNMLPKEQEKIRRHIEHLEKKAARLVQKEHKNL